MPMMGRFRVLDWFLLLVVLATAGGARAWYLCEYAACGDAEVLAVRGVQADETQALDIPPASPGYDIVRDQVMHLVKEHAADKIGDMAAIRWIHVVLGSLTAGLYFALARRAFASSLVGLIAGLLVALNPFAILNVAELQDGVLASFLLAFALASGARAGQRGGAAPAVLFGLSLAGLGLVRLALAPFVLVTLIWFLNRSRTLRYGWLYGLLAFLGFAGPVATWMVQKHQETQDPLPIVDTAWYHVWLGNNPHATGGPQDGDPKAILGDDVAKLKHDAHRLLADKVMTEAIEHPYDTVERRLVATLYFFAGKADGQRGGMFEENVPPDENLPWLSDCLYTCLFFMLVLGFLGWRWSYVWRWHSMPLQLAVVWAPLPYLLSHAEPLHGPRLPLDGVLLTLSALAIGCFIPGLRTRLLEGKLPADAATEPKPPPPQM